MLGAGECTLRMAALCPRQHLSCCSHGLPPSGLAPWDPAPTWLPSGLVGRACRGPAVGRSPTPGLAQRLPQSRPPRASPGALARVLLPW